MYHIFLSPRLDHSTSFFLPFSTSAAAAAISRRPLSSLPVRGRRQLRQVREISPLLPFPNRVSYGGGSEPIGCCRPELVGSLDVMSDLDPKVENGLEWVG